MDKECNERFALLRKSLHMNQADFGKILGLTVSGVSDIERKKRNVTEKHIKLLCIEPIDGKYVNEDYIRTGQGGMFIDLPANDEVALYVSELLEDSQNPFCELIIEIMHTYSQLSPKSQEVLRDAAAKLCENLAKKKEG